MKAYDSISLIYIQACKLKFRLRVLTSCLCSTAALAVWFKGRVAGVDIAGNEVSHLIFQFTSLLILDGWTNLEF